MFASVAERCCGRGDCGEEFFRGEWDADDAGGGRKDFVEDTAELVADGDAAFEAGVEAGLSCGAVGVAGVDDERGDFASGCGEMFAADGYRSGDDLVAGKQGRGGGSAGTDGRGRRRACRWP